MTNREEITKRLLLFVNSKKWGKSDFARAAGIHRQNSDRYLTGKSDPSKIAIKLMTEGLNVEWLLTGEGEMLTDEQEMRRSYVNARRTAEKQASNDVLSESPALYRFPPDNIIKALGKAMCIEGIQDGDMIILDQEGEAKEGDLVLRLKNEVPTIERFRNGDQPPIAICQRLMRNLKKPAKPRTLL